MRWERLGRTRWFFLLAVALAVACGDPDPGQQTNDEDRDVGVDADAGVDTAVDVDVGPDGDVDEDADDGQGQPAFPINGPDDNCPHIDNPDQLDRSRDGVGDACANFPYYHDPSNPEWVEVIDEDEGPPNDNFWDARQDWMLELPFMLEGGIGEAGELDYYAFEIDEPTTVLFHLEARSSQIWPTMIVLGDDTHNMDYQAVVLGPNQGESEVRDVHLPLPGAYVFVISDYHNLTGGGGNAGGEGYEYRLSASLPPLPDGQGLSFPAPRRVVDYSDGVAGVFSVDAAGQDALKVEATGAPRNQFSVAFPSIEFINADTGEMLAFTLESQVDTDSLRNELTLKIGDDVQRIDVVVEAHTSLGVNDLVVDFEFLDKPEHLSSFDNPRTTWEDHLLWMSLDTTLASEIGPPRPSSDTSLEPDEDYFVYFANPGHFVEIRAVPHADSLLVPEVAIGRLWSSGFFNGWHRGYGASEPGEVGWLSALITDEDWSGAVIQVRHSGNAFSDLPVGGPRYGYDLVVESVDIDDVVEVVDEFPEAIPIVLEAGQQRVWEFPFRPGYTYDVTYNGSWGRNAKFIDRNTWEVVASTSSDMEFVAEPGRDLIVAIRANSGYPVQDSFGIVFEIDEGEPPAQLEVGEEVAGTLDMASPQQIYRIPASAGDLVEARVSATAGPSPEVELFGGEQADRGRAAEGTVAVARADGSGELLVVVSADPAEDVEYLLSVEAVEPEPISAPHEVIGNLEGGGDTRWFSVDAAGYEYFAINGVADDSAGAPHLIGVFDGSDLSTVVESDRGFTIFETTGADEILFFVADRGGPPSEGRQFGLSLSAVDAQSYDGAADYDVVDGLRPIFLEIDISGGGLATMSVSAPPQGGVSVQIADGSEYEIFRGQRWDSNLTAVARNDLGDWTGIVIPESLSGQSWSADVEIEVVPQSEARVLDAGQAMVGEPLEVDEWPGAYIGTLDGEGSARYFVADLTAGDELWVLTAPAGGAASPTLELLGPDGAVRDVAAVGGSTGFPVLLPVTIDEDGPWEIVVSNQSGVGQFAIYLLRR